MIKWDIKYKYNIYIQSYKCFFFTFKESQNKMYQIFHKSKKVIVNINNKKYFLSTKSAYYNDFWNIWHWRLE